MTGGSYSIVRVLFLPPSVVAQADSDAVALLQEQVGVEKGGEVIQTLAHAQLQQGRTRLENTGL